VDVRQGSAGLQVTGLTMEHREGRESRRAARHHQHGCRVPSRRGTPLPGLPPSSLHYRASARSGSGGRPSLCGDVLQCFGQELLANSPVLDHLALGIFMRVATVPCLACVRPAWLALQSGYRSCASSYAAGERKVVPPYSPSNCENDNRKAGVGPDTTICSVEPTWLQSQALYHSQELALGAA
jgi:hypothetical protein